MHYGPGTGVSRYDLRHVFRSRSLTRLLYSGRDIANVQAPPGHKSIPASQRYLGYPSTQLRHEACNSS